MISEGLRQQDGWGTQSIPARFKIKSCRMQSSPSPRLSVEPVRTDLARWRALVCMVPSAPMETYPMRFLLRLAIATVISMLAFIVMLIGISLLDPAANAAERLVLFDGTIPSRVLWTGRGMAARFPTILAIPATMSARCHHCRRPDRRSGFAGLRRGRCDG